MDRTLYLQILRHQLESWHQTRLGYEYMGAAEFEWGSIPQAWGALRRAADAGTLLVGKTGDVDVDLVRFAKPNLVGRFHLYYAACPTYYNVHYKVMPFDPVATLENLLRYRTGVPDKPLRSHESPRLARVLAGEAMDGWLSVCPHVSEGGPRNPIFVATPSETFHDLLLEKITTWEPK